jgi:hypothetical protein
LNACSAVIRPFAVKSGAVTLKWPAALAGFPFALFFAWAPAIEVVASIAITAVVTCRIRWDLTIANLLVVCANVSPISTLRE